MVTSLDLNTTEAAVPIPATSILPNSDQFPQKTIYNHHL